MPENLADGTFLSARDRADGSLAWVIEVRGGGFWAFDGADSFWLHDLLRWLYWFPERHDSDLDFAAISAAEALTLARSQEAIDALLVEEFRHRGWLSRPAADVFGKGWRYRDVVSE